MNLLCQYKSINEKLKQDLRNEGRIEGVRNRNIYSISDQS